MVVVEMAAIGKIRKLQFSEMQLTAVLGPTETHLRVGKCCNALWTAVSSGDKCNEHKIS